MVVDNCFCFDLRSGSLIIIWLDLLCEIILATHQHYAFTLMLIVPAFALYGIYQRKPVYLWPQMLVQLAEITFLMLSGIFIFGETIIFSFGLANIPHESLNSHDRRTLDLLVGAGIGLMLFAILLYLAVLALVIYFMAVIVSLYRKMVKEDEEIGQSMPIHHIETGFDYTNFK